MTAPAHAELAAIDATLRGTVERHAHDVVERAREQTRTRVEQAQQQAEALSRRAREEGDAAADLLLARERAALRRDTGRVVFDARSAVLAELRDAIRGAVAGLRTAPDYPELLDGLTRRARSRLGPGAVIVRDPEPLGGIVAELAGERIDYTLPALADLALADLGAAFEELWQ